MRNWWAMMERAVIDRAWTGDGVATSVLRGPQRRWVLGIVALGVVQGIVHVVNYFTIDVGYLDVNLERRPFAAIQGLLIAAAAAGAFVVTARRLVPRAIGLSLGAVLAFFALDEVAGLHERIAVEVGELMGLSDSWDSVLWPVLYLPLAAVVLFGIWRCAVAAPPPNARLLLMAGALLVSAVVLEIASAPFSTASTAGGAVHKVEGAFEEGFELVAWGFIALALLTWTAAADAVGRSSSADRRRRTTVRPCAEPG